MHLRGLERGQQQREHARGQHHAGTEAEQHALHAGADAAHHQQRNRAERGGRRRHRATGDGAGYRQIETVHAAHELGDQQGEAGEGDQPAAQCAQGAARAGGLEMQAGDLVDHGGTPRLSCRNGHLRASDDSSIGLRVR